MSCSMTVEAVRERRKTVTRRHVDTWRTLKPGDRLTLVEKGMGLAKGERHVVLAEVEVVDVRVEPMCRVLSEPDATTREGLPEMEPVDFMWWWIDSHYSSRSALVAAGLPPEGPPCRRIEWRYLDDSEADR